MTTYRDESAAGDTTTWLYDEPTGLVTNKLYADGKGPSYAYTDDGKLATRTWARGIVTTYAYDGWGNLTNTTYSDGTPTISLAYDALGRLLSAIDAAGLTTFLYDRYGQLTNETVVGVAGTNTIARFYDTYGRDAGYALNSERQTTLAYDPATGRLATMLAAGSEVPFVWNYLPGSDLKSSFAYPNGLTASWTYGKRGELLEVNNASPTDTISKYIYTYDATGRRISCAHSGSAFNAPDTKSYLYNLRSELTNATAAVDADYRYGYDFDDIGNRESSSERGTNTTYTANELNQYTNIEYSAVQPSTSNLQPIYDADGNQTLVKTATGIWSVTYNGENRPIRWELVNANSNTSNSNTQTLLTMTYDRMGRRVAKNAQRFVYNGYLQIANFRSTTTTSDCNYFVWDVTEPIATRPLVWKRGTSVAYYSHDGNKNVSEVIAADRSLAAHYEYAPFGAVIKSTGAENCPDNPSTIHYSLLPIRYLNPWRFSSEFADDELGCDYYNYREYEPMTGRWLCRDGAEDGDVPNYYSYCANRMGEYDFLGLWLGYRHKKLTKRAFEHEESLFAHPFGEDISVKFDLEKIRDVIVEANVDTDSDHATADDQGYHYCTLVDKDYDGMAHDKYRKRYTQYLGDKGREYHGFLKPENLDCEQALKILGLLSHMWQDYYAHGVEKDDSWIGAVIGKIKGSPDDPQMIPVGYGAGGFRGGHGGAFRLLNPFTRVEPGDRADDSDVRRSQAKWFTIEKFQEFLPVWVDACKCEKEWWAK